MSVKSYKIINDPVHGFINIPHGLIMDLVTHKYFQRLREIKQLGLTNLVYPGATHSRLIHALGAMHLMREAIAILRYKGISIDDSEEEAALCAILLHDIGHSPYSHALEGVIVQGVSHEEISIAIMSELNREFNGSLSLAIDIFSNNYCRPFFHQLVSSQLDVDRLDYLRRDSFFSGVAEGMIGSERIIKMLNVVDDYLVIEQKGIYSVEKFLISRRLMYWQVYLHKTVLSAERLIVSIFKRVRELLFSGYSLEIQDCLLYFMINRCSSSHFNCKEVLNKFTSLDDSDIIFSIKQWQFSSDPILSALCRMLVERNLPKLTIYSDPISNSFYEQKREEVFSMIDRSIFNSLESSCSDYFIEKGEVSNRGYDSNSGEIKILDKQGGVTDIYILSDMLSPKAFSNITKKYFLCTANLK